MKPRPLVIYCRMSLCGIQPLDGDRGLLKALIDFFFFFFFYMPIFVFIKQNHLKILRIKLNKVKKNKNKQTVVGLIKERSHVYCH